MSARQGRRPYRVVFTRPGPPGAERRRGTIVAATIEVARLEARQIAVTGGTAEVHHVSETGERETLERFDAVPSPPGTVRPLPVARLLSGAGQRPAM